MLSIPEFITQFFEGARFPISREIVTWQTGWMEVGHWFGNFQFRATIMGVTSVCNCLNRNIISTFEFEPINVPRTGADVTTSITTCWVHVPAIYSERHDNEIIELNVPKTINENIKTLAHSEIVGVIIWDSYETGMRLLNDNQRSFGIKCWLMRDKFLHVELFGRLLNISRLCTLVLLNLLCTRIIGFVWYLLLSHYFYRLMC